MSARIFSAVGVVIFVLGSGLGVWALMTEREEINIGSSAWSPDGQQLVFVWNHALYTINIDGTHCEKLSSVRGDYREPAWSPQADRIVYMFRKNESAPYALWLIEGQDARRALPEQSLEEFFPHWSPDGNWLGFYRTSNYDGSPSEYGYGHFVLTDFTKIYAQPAEFGITDDMEWSPDSKAAAFVGFRDHWNIYSLALDGTNIQQLTDSSYDRSPAWSPDGRQLAFYSERDTQQNWIGSIYILDISSQNIKRITGTVDRTQQIEWSPGGGKIALATYNYSADQTDLFVMNADGTDLHSMETDIRGLIAWSPDGRLLAFTVSNNLIVLDVNANEIILRYHPKYFFLPAQAVRWIALIMFLTGPLFTVNLTQGSPVWAMLRAYTIFLTYIISLVALAGFLAAILCSLYLILI